jgi:quercetin dioxygenase-like cupin family protein
MRSAFVASVFAMLIGGLSAQQPGFSRTVIQRGDLSTPGREVVSAIAEFQPGSTAGPHTHPGEEAGYLLEGTLVFELTGKPPVTLKAGETFFVPAGMVHNATNKGSVRARVLATYIVEKGKPIATAAK